MHFPVTSFSSSDSGRLPDERRVMAEGQASARARPGSCSTLTLDTVLKSVSEAEVWGGVLGYI